MEYRNNKMVVIADNYPSLGRPVNVFVQQFVEQIVDMGIDVSVIAPQSVTNSFIRGNKLREKMAVVITSQGNRYSVFRPYTFTTGNKIKILDKIFNFFLRKSLANIIKRINPNVIYGHFWQSAHNAYQIAKKCNIPIFVASGESSIRIDCSDKKGIKEFADYVAGVICVSTKNKNESVALGLTIPEKCIVIPNAIDPSKFYKKDKIQVRELLGIAKDDFVIAFVGSFIERKGSNRVAAAIKQLNNPAIKSIFVGKPMSNDNRFIPECDGILFRGTLEHNKIADYLNAADVFVLPTLHEGCCNAIVEAMACGLPIISSDRDFNYDILNSNNSILVDPNNIDCICQAIEKLYNDKKLRDKMSRIALETAFNLNIGNRASVIIEFIQSKIANRL